MMASMYSLLMLVTLVSWTSSQTTRPKCPNLSYHAYYDFLNNYTVTNEYITPVVKFTGEGCSTRGVLQIALASAATDPYRRRVLIDLFFTSPTNWVFNLGDSRTNNGYGGDAETQRWDAEVQGFGKTFSGYLSDNGGSGRVLNIPKLYSTRLTVIVGDGHIVWLPNKHHKFNYYYSPYFFGLNGQTEPDGTSNYDLYLGINRVIWETFGRIGTGICSFGITFLKEY